MCKVHPPRIDKELNRNNTPQTHTCRLLAYTKPQDSNDV